MVLVTEDKGQVFFHKIVLFKMFPRLKEYLCQSCFQDHNDIVILVPGNDLATVEKARDDLYLFDETIRMEQLLGLKKKESVMKDQDLGADYEILFEESFRNVPYESLEDVATELMDCKDDDNFRDVIIDNYGKGKFSGKNKCMICGFKTSSINTISKHMATKHAKCVTNRNIGSYAKMINGTIVCTECNKNYKNKFSLKQHILRKHKQNKVDKMKYFHRYINCKEISFKTPKLRKKNITEKISVVRTDTESSDKEMLLNNVSGHNLEESNEYKNYEPVYNAIDNMMKTKVDIHKKNNSRMVYSCQICNHNTFTKAILRKHMAEKHTNTIRNMDTKPFENLYENCINNHFCEESIHSPKTSTPKNNIVAGINVQTPLTIRSLSFQAKTNFPKNHSEPNLSYNIA